MKNKPIHILALWGLMVASGLQAQDVTDFSEVMEEEVVPDDAISLMLNSQDNEHAKEFVANVISDRFKFLDLGYVKTDGNSASDGWSAKYNWHYQNNLGGGFGVEKDAATLKNMQLEIDVSGTYSYGNADNTDDYSSGKLAFSYLYGRFGEINTITREASDEFQSCLSDALSFEEQDDFLAAESQCWVDYRIEDIVSNGSDSYVFSVAVTAGLEGDQSYKSQQSTYGFTSTYSRADLPSFRLSYEKVDARKDEKRMMLTNEEQYDRFSAELGYRYKLFQTQGYSTWLYFSYRYFREVSAPQVIKDEGFNEFDFVSVSVRFPSKLLGFLETDKVSLYIRYTEGQLPFDNQSDKAIQLGFSTNIQTLAAFLGQ